jgi:hypothetical protein
MLHTLWLDGGGQIYVVSLSPLTVEMGWIEVLHRSIVFMSVVWRRLLHFTYELDSDRYIRLWSAM